MTRAEGRLHGPTLTATVAESGDTTLQVKAPGVGQWRPMLALGQTVRAGDVVGELTTLGAVARVVAGSGARGAVVAITGANRAASAVDHGAVLYTLDPNAGVSGTADVSGPAATSETALVFRAPSSGRFYGRPAPGKPAFVAVGEVVKLGQTVCMLEVMKTFHRITYGGPGLPETARITAIAVVDESDVEPGTVLLHLGAVA